MKRTIVCSLLLALFCGCNNQQEKKEEKVVVAKETAPAVKGLTQQDSIKAIGRQVLSLLKAQNYKELTTYFSADGVLFSPYGFIDTAQSKRLTPEDFLQAVDKNWTLTWGHFDGTGEPIKLSVKAYLKKFVWNADYLNAEAVGFDQVIKQGNSSNNLKTIYPNRHFIDYHFSGFDQKYNGMDWSSLRLVFENDNGEYFLVAIIHDQWTV